MSGGVVVAGEIPPARPTCSTCEYWERMDGAGNRGECRAHPPIPTALFVPGPIAGQMVIQVICASPQTNGDTWFACHSDLQF